MKLCNRSLNQGNTAEWEQRLVLAHAGAAASGQDEACE
jgi:hypothetical protein